MSPPLQMQTSDPAIAYGECVSEGKLKDDEAQRLVMQRLHALYNALIKSKNRGLIARILPQRAADAPRSIYIWGEVGRGKSLLMDMFYAHAPVPKRRVHFHAFMQEVHAESHRWRSEIEAKGLKEDLLTAVARDIATQSGQLICLDELQVTDVADAMILSKLFTVWLNDKVTFVITSNRPPEELYLGGLQREKFLDFVHLIYARLDVMELASPTDYRMQQIRSLQTVYMWPDGLKAKHTMQHIFEELTHHTPLQPATLEVQGRKFPVNESYGGIARFTFRELCAMPVGSAEYLAIARRFHTIFLTGIPKLTPENRNEARRFVTLIDTLYDCRVKLICTAEAQPAELYPAGDGTFEFARTVSRLAEMQSESYLATPHIP